MFSNFALDRGALLKRLKSPRCAIPRSEVNDGQQRRRNFIVSVKFQGLGKQLFEKRSGILRTTKSASLRGSICTVYHAACHITSQFVSAQWSTDSPSCGMSGNCVLTSMGCRASLREALRALSLSAS